MKRNLLTFVLSVLAVFFTVHAQTAETIIFLNFQDWTASPEVYSDADSCETGQTFNPGPDKFQIDYLTGGSGEIELWDYVVSPVCNCKHWNRDGQDCAIDITPGWVELGKLSDPDDTIGTLILPKMTNVTWIEVGFSCTGDGRGLRIYASTDDGENWTGPIGGEHLDGNQDGAFATEDINMDNVIIKLTSGVDNSDVSQYARIHNIEVKGVPGGPETGVSEMTARSIEAYYTSGEGLVVKGDVHYLAVYDITGRLILESHETGNQTVPLTSLSDGVYFVKAFDRNHKVYTRKFVVK